jgi:hypothetical protein
MRMERQWNVSIGQASAWAIEASLIGHFSRWLDQQDLKVGLVTNDQGVGLMETDSVRRANGNKGVEEIARRELHHG